MNNTYNESTQVTNAILLQNDYENVNIIPSRSSLRNITFEQIQQDKIIISAKNCIHRIINTIILLLSLPIIITDLFMISNSNSEINYCITKIVDLSNTNEKNINTKIEFSLFAYFIGDIFISIIILFIINYFINIGYRQQFSLSNYRKTIILSKCFVLLQTIWIILGVLTVIDKELFKVCSIHMYTFIYANIVTRGILLIILTLLVINNYYIL